MFRRQQSQLTDLQYVAVKAHDVSAAKQLLFVKRADPHCDVRDRLGVYRDQAATLADLVVHQVARHEFVDCDDSGDAKRIQNAQEVHVCSAKTHSIVHLA